MKEEILRKKLKNLTAIFNVGQLKRSIRYDIATRALDYPQGACEWFDKFLQEGVKFGMDYDESSPCYMHTYYDDHYYEIEDLRKQYESEGCKIEDILKINTDFKVAFACWAFEIIACFFNFELNLKIRDIK